MLQTEQQETRLATWLGVFLNLMSGIILMALMLITCIDVLGRYLFNNPLTGSTELIEIGLGLLVFMALPVICWRSENIVVDILDEYCSALVHLLRGIVMHVVFALILYFLGLRLVALGERSLGYGEVSEFLHIPLGWSTQVIGYMCLLSALSLVSFGMLNLWSQYRLRQRK